MKNLDIEIRHGSLQLKGKINTGDESRDKADLLKMPVAFSQEGFNESTFLKEERGVSQGTEGLDECGSEIKAKKKMSIWTYPVDTADSSSAYGIARASLGPRFILCQSKALPSIELYALCFFSSDTIKYLTISLPSKFLTWIGLLSWVY